MDCDGRNSQRVSGLLCLWIHDGDGYFLHVGRCWEDVVMAVRRYVARWCEGDFDENGECLDQEWMTETFDTLFDAQVAAFKNANAQATCVHCYCEVDVLELGEHGYETLRTLVNHHDFGNKWSGWITEDKYKAQYGE